MASFITRFTNYPDEKLIAILKDDPSKYQEAAIQAAEIVLKKRGYEPEKIEAYKQEMPVVQAEDPSQSKYQRLVYTIFAILLLLVALFRLIIFVENGQVWQMFGFLLLLIAGVVYAVHQYLRPLL
ncbi:MAG: hypothetical protein IPL49_02265 [Saprospirales bacterium]|nr:hypothetical protein [Saprospirales bacterium]MBK8489741.1 hypothetical protein [Saprospirales bacterium]